MTPEEKEAEQLVEKHKLAGYEAYICRNAYLEGVLLKDLQWKAKLEELIQKWTKRENELEDVYKAAELSRCAADLESLLEQHK